MPGRDVPPKLGHGTDADREVGIGVNFAPAVLVGTFVVWMTLLVLGYR